MTSLVADVALVVESSLAFSILAKVTVALILAMIAVRLARRSRAAVRHLLWTAAFAVVLALPVASILTPSVAFVELPVAAGSVTGRPSFAPVKRFTPATDAVQTVSGRRATVRQSRFSLFAVMWTGWAIGAVLFLMPVLIGLWQVRTLRRAGRPWYRGQLLARQLAADAGIHRGVEVLLQKSVSGPANCGVVKPAILLPLDAQGWDEKDLQRAIVHELDHVRRFDRVTQCVARVLCVSYWFHPLVWIAWRRLVLEAERSCDDAVLRRAEATDYANQLVVLAQRMSTAPNRPLLTMANRTDLSARVSAVLDNRQRRGRVGTLRLALVCIAAALLVATISPLRVITTAQTGSAFQRLAGLLVDQAGRPVPDVMLTLLNVSSKQRTETHSNQTGRFAFSGVPAGQYLLQIREFGFAPMQETITLPPGQGLDHKFVLKLSGGVETVTVYSSEAPAALPPLPSPPPSPSTTFQPYANQAELDRCAQASIFCRVTPGHKIADPKPIYPPKERESRIAGNVALDGKIGKDGLIKVLSVIGPANPDFVRATVDALRRWQFSTTLLDGVPIEVPIRVVVKIVVR
jgi:beta-lactamase regulating signal transducer with metallopeptidase domain